MLYLFLKDVPTCRYEDETDEDVEHADGEARLKMRIRLISFHSRYLIPLSLEWIGLLT